MYTFYIANYICYEIYNNFRNKSIFGINGRTILHAWMGNIYVNTIIIKCSKYFISVHKVIDYIAQIITGCQIRVKIS